MGFTPSATVPAGSLAPYKLPSLSRSGVVALLIRISGAAVMLLSHIVLARSLGVTGFGEYAQAIAWCQVFCMLGKLGLDNASLRYVAEYLTRQDSGRLSGFIRDSTRASIATSVVIMFGVMAASLFNRKSLGDHLTSCLMIASLMIPLISLRQIQEASLRGVGLVWKSQISMVAWPSILFVLTTVVWKSSSASISSRTATLLHLVTMTIVSGVTWWFIRHSPLQHFRTAKRESCRRQWMNTALAFLLAELLIVLKTRICVALAGLFLGADSAGLYAAMERFADVSILGSTSMGLVIAPQFASLYAAGRFAEMRKLMWQGQILCVGTTLPISLAIAYFHDDIFWLLGSDFREGSSALMALLASACIASVAGPAAYVLQMSGYERTMLAITATSAVSNVVFSMLLMPPCGILGLGISQMATSFVWIMGLRVCLRKHPAWQNVSPPPDKGDSFVEMKEAA